MLVIRDEALVKQLQEMAAREGRSVEEILTRFVDQMEAERDQQYGITGEELLEIVDKFAFSGTNPIDATQADDILNAEFADDLLKRAENGTPSKTSR